MDQAGAAMCQRQRGMWATEEEKGDVHDKVYQGSRLFSVLSLS